MTSARRPRSSKVAELVQRNRKQVYRWMKQHAVGAGTGRKDP